jgi:hypothetical protein
MVRYSTEDIPVRFCPLDVVIVLLRVSALYLGYIPRIKEPSGDQFHLEQSKEVRRNDLGTGRIGISVGIF